MKVEKNFYDSHKDAEGIQGKAVNGARSRSKMRASIANPRGDATRSVRDALFLLLLPLENSYLYTFHSKWGYGVGEHPTVCYRRGQRTTYTYTKVSSAL